VPLELPDPRIPDIDLSAAFIHDNLATTNLPESEDALASWTLVKHLLHKVVHGILRQPNINGVLALHYITETDSFKLSLLCL